MISGGTLGLRFRQCVVNAAAAVASTIVCRYFFTGQLRRGTFTFTVKFATRTRQQTDRRQNSTTITRDMGSLAAVIQR